MWPYPWSVPPVKSSSNSEVSEDRWAGARLTHHHARKSGPTPKKHEPRRTEREPVIERREAWNEEN